jgi:small multidrug resistance pump
MRWVLLLAAVVCEVAATLSLKAALEDTRLYTGVVVGYVSAFLLLAAVLRRGMPLGVAYGIWGALGVAFTAVLARVVFGEPLDTVMGLGLGLIVAGILVVELGSQRAEQQALRGPGTL